MKCEKCGYTSFDHNHLCPSCGKSLEKTRDKLGIHYNPPDPGGLDGLFATSRVVQQVVDVPGLDLDFTLDD